MTDLSTLLDLANKHYRVHLRVFSAYAVVALILILIFAQWWLFWPTMIWFLIFGVHFLTYKSLNIDNEWVDERIARTTDKAYDLSHIENIRDGADSEHARSKSKQIDLKEDAAPAKEAPATGNDKG